MTEEESEDLRMVLHFWEEKGDPSRYTGWQRVIARFPEIRQAWVDCKTEIRRAEDKFTAIIKENQGE